LRSSSNQLESVDLSKQEAWSVATTFANEMVSDMEKERWVYDTTVKALRMFRYLIKNSNRLGNDTNAIHLTTMYVTASNFEEKIVGQSKITGYLMQGQKRSIEKREQIEVQGEGRCDSPSSTGTLVDTPMKTSNPNPDPNPNPRRDPDRRLDPTSGPDPAPGPNSNSHFDANPVMTWDDIDAQVWLELPESIRRDLRRQVIGGRGEERETKKPLKRTIHAIKGSSTTTTTTSSTSSSSSSASARLSQLWRQERGVGKFFIKNKK